MDEQGHSTGGLEPYHWPEVAPAGASPLASSATAAHGGQPRGNPDPGSRPGAIVAWVVLLGAVATLFAIARIAPLFFPAEQAEQPKVSAPSMENPVALTTELMVKLADSGFADDPAARAQIAAQIDSVALAPETPVVGRFRAAIAAAEVAGKPEGLSRLDAIGEKALADADLTDDAAALRAILTGEGSLSVEQANLLVDRHGWFGRLALVLDSPRAAPEHAEVVSGGGYLIALAALMCVVALVIVVGGITCGIIAIFKIIATVSGAGRPRAFTPPSPGGSVYLETAALFVLSFLILHLALELWAKTSGVSESTALSVQLLVQWCILPTIFWARLRGVPGKQWRREIGWHAPRGLWREVGAGLFMYLAGLPVLLLALAVTIAIVAARAALYHSAGEPAPQADNPILKLISEAGPWQMAAFVLLATVWAPIVEESIFRGSLFRHFRSRRGLLLSALLSALFFGVLHSYELLLLAPVISLGFVFALMREWRGSIIPSAVAHAVHNGTIMLFVLLLRGAL